jgi:hypothetical protein
MTWPPVLLWLLIIAAALSRGPLIIYLFSGTMIFGALTMAPAGLTGGLNLPAQTICAAILIVKIFLRSNNLNLALRHGFDVRKLGLLGFFLVYVVFTAIIYPRFFRGDVMLYSLNAAVAESPVHPTSANFTQTLYLLTSIGIAFAFAVAARNPAFRELYLRTVLIAAVLLVASGVINLTLNAVGELSLLEPFHNASYASLDTVQLAGQYRVVGLMPEASAYGGATCTVLSFLVFNYRYFKLPNKRVLLPGLILLLGSMTVLSTSSTGYLGLIVLIGLAAGRIVFNLLLIPIRSHSRLRKTTYLVLFLMTVLMLLVLFGPLLFSKYQDLLNTVLFKKTTSSSYQERTRWSVAGLHAFYSTYGIGVGVGSVRTSNWFVNILASTGVFGVFLFFAFALRLFIPFRGRNWPDENRGFSNSLKLCLIPAAIMVGVSGTTPDPGVWVMSVFGLLYGLQLKPQGEDYRSTRILNGNAGERLT